MVGLVVEQVRQDVLERLLMRDGEFLTIDTARVAREARAFAARIKEALAERRP